MKQKKFKKGDKGYLIVNSPKSFSDETAVVKCDILKVSTEDRIISYSSDVVSKKPMFVADSSHNHANYPWEVAFVTYVCPFRGDVVNTWTEMENLKRNPTEFYENQMFIDMSKSLKNYQIYD